MSNWHFQVFDDDTIERDSFEKDSFESFKFVNTLTNNIYAKQRWDGGREWVLVKFLLQKLQLAQANIISIDKPKKEINER